LELGEASSRQTFKKTTAGRIPSFNYGEQDMSIVVSRTVKIVTAASLLGVLYATPLWADSARFSESITDKLVGSRDPGPPPSTSYDVTTTDTGTLTCSVTIAGLKGLKPDASTPVSVSLGGWVFSATLGDAAHLGRHTATFYQTVTFENPKTGGTISKNVAKITLTQKDNVLAISATSQDLADSSFVAANYVGTPVAFNGQLTLSVSFGELNAPDLTLNYKGTSTVKSKTVGSGDNKESFDLNAVKVSGSMAR
jgi:hypothetical protein